MKKITGTIILTNFILLTYFNMIIDNLTILLSIHIDKYFTILHVIKHFGTVNLIFKYK